MNLAEPIYTQMSTEVDVALDTAWVKMAPAGRACFNPQLLAELTDYFGKPPRASFTVLASDDKSAFSLGGDLTLFQHLITAGRQDSLQDYAISCIDVLYDFYSYKSNTIALVENDALGGGFEAVLAADHVIAEEHVKFGFPKILFGLFPGMGAVTWLTRRIGANKAMKLTTSGQLFSAHAAHELGLVHQVVPAGEGREAARRYVADNLKRSKALLAMAHARNIAEGVKFEELRRVVDLWTDTAMQLKKRDLSLMARLAKRQLKKAA